MQVVNAGSKELVKADLANVEFGAKRSHGALSALALAAFSSLSLPALATAQKAPTPKSSTPAAAALDVRSPSLSMKPDRFVSRSLSNDRGAEDLRKSDMRQAIYDSAEDTGTGTHYPVVLLILRTDRGIGRPLVGEAIRGGAGTASRSTILVSNFPEVLKTGDYEAIERGPLPSLKQDPVKDPWNTVIAETVRKLIDFKEKVDCVERFANWMVKPEGEKPSLPHKVLGGKDMLAALVEVKQKIAAVTLKQYELAIPGNYQLDLSLKSDPEKIKSLEEISQLLGKRLSEEREIKALESELQKFATHVEATSAAIDRLADIFQDRSVKERFYPVWVVIWDIWLDLQFNFVPLVSEIRLAARAKADEASDFRRKYTENSKKFANGFLDQVQIEKDKAKLEYQQAVQDAKKLGEEADAFYLEAKPQYDRLVAANDKRNGLIEQTNRLIEERKPLDEERRDIDKKTQELKALKAKTELSAFTGCPNNHPFDACTHTEEKKGWLNHRDWLLLAHTQGSARVSKQIEAFNSKVEANNKAYEAAHAEYLVADADYQNHLMNWKPLADRSDKLKVEDSRIRAKLEHAHEIRDLLHDIDLKIGGFLFLMPSRR